MPKVTKGMGIQTSTVREYGVHFATGTPVTFKFLRNTEKAGDFGSRFQQDIEPSGVYVLHNPEPGDLPNKWIRGTISLRSPLVIPLNANGVGLYDDKSWKAALFTAYKKKKKALSSALRRDGYDAVVTTDGGGGTREIVILDPSLVVVSEDLTEGRMEHETRVISRYIVSEFKKNRVEPPKDLGNAIATLGMVTISAEKLAELLPGSTVNGIMIMVEFLFNPQSEIVSGGGFYQFTKTPGLATKKPLANGDLYVAGPDLPRAISVTITVGPNFKFSNLIVKLKEVLRHELEHYSQPMSMLAADGWAKRLRSGEPDDVISYYLNPAEIQAHVAGFYKEAKIRKQPLGKVFKSYLTNIGERMEFAYVPRPEINKVKRKLLAAWTKYAKTRFPHAVLTTEGFLDLTVKVLEGEEPEALVGRITESAVLFYHLTSKARFKLDPKQIPSDNAIAIAARESPGIFLAHRSGVEPWVNGHGYFRPFVVELEVDDAAVRPERWGGEMFLPASDFSKARIVRVIPIDAFCREEFGEYGWTETFFGTTFDTDEPISKEEIRKHPFSSWRWDGDVRKLSSSWVAQYRKRVSKYLRMR